MSAKGSGLSGSAGSGAGHTAAARSKNWYALRLVAAAVFVLSWLAVAPAAVPHVLAAGDPVIAAAGDIACDPQDPNFNSGNGTTTYCMQKATSSLLVGGGYSGILSLGDNQYYCGSLTAYQQVYAGTWGQVKAITHPVPGNHEYLTAGGSQGATGCDQSNLNGAGYYGYFGSAAGTSGQGWYSFDLGSWHLIALNSNCTAAGGCGATSPQGKWLVADLASHPNQCVLAYWHIPLFSSGGRANNNSKFFWTALYAAHADLVLDGHDHIYERFAPQTPAGLPDAANGITQITVGTGGADHTGIAAVAANSLVRDTTSYGILALTLHQSSYSYNFVRATGAFADSGSASCHSAGATPTPTPTPTPDADPDAAGHAAPRCATPDPRHPGATPTPTPAPTPTPIATPTPTPATSGTATFNPAADSYVDTSQTGTNFGKSTQIRIDGSPSVNGYLTFNVTGITGTVTSAALRLFANSAQSTGFTAYSVPNTTWGETTITASNAPPFATALGSSGKLTAGTWAAADVTAAITGNGTFSFGIATTNATAVSFSSREGVEPAAARHHHDERRRGNPAPSTGPATGQPNRRDPPGIAVAGTRPGPLEPADGAPAAARLRSRAATPPERLAVPRPESPGGWPGSRIQKGVGLPGRWPTYPREWPGSQGASTCPKGNTNLPGAFAGVTITVAVDPPRRRIWATR